MRRGGSAESVVDLLSEHGWAARFVPIGRVLDAWSELEGRRTSGELDGALFREYLAPLGGAIDSPPKGMRSVLVAAVPDPMIRIRFAWRGGEVPVTVPPTYLHWRDRDGEVEGVVAAALDGAGHRVQRTNVPKKLLATRSGLAKYGRNNITYVEGTGSYHRLVALHTSVPCAADPWREPEMMSACEECRACLESCPTGAIAGERFLLQAERCLTFWNEKPADVPFPEGLDPSCHNQLVGCMRCQAVCPANAGHLTIEEADPTFTEEETAAFLRGAAADELTAETIDKLREHDLLDYLEVFPRNLRALLHLPSAGPAIG